MFLHQKMIRIYADIIQNHTMPGVFPNFWRAVCVYIYIYIYISGVKISALMQAINVFRLTR